MLVICYLCKSRSRHERARSGLPLCKCRSCHKKARSDSIEMTHFKLLDWLFTIFLLREHERALTQNAYILQLCRLRRTYSCRQRIQMGFFCEDIISGNKCFVVLISGTVWKHPTRTLDIDCLVAGLYYSCFFYEFRFFSKKNCTHFRGLVLEWFLIKNSLVARAYEKTNNLNFMTGTRQQRKI